MSNCKMTVFEVDIFGKGVNDLCYAQAHSSQVEAYKLVRHVSECKAPSPNQKNSLLLHITIALT